MTLTVTIVGKGPSAIHAQEWIDACPGTDVCSINESAMILRPDQPVRFCFFCHGKAAALTRPLWERVPTFVSPRHLIGKSPMPKGFPYHKRLTYAGNACPSDAATLRAMLVRGSVTHHHTIPAAMSWLAKLGYRRLRIIGVGGTGYAPGFTGQPQNIGDDWVETEKTLADLLKELFGVETERFDG